MASKKVSLLKFVGTVSLGLLTGASYTLSTLTIPSLLELPSASTAAKAYRSLTDTATTHLNALTGLSGTAFFLAFALSPRPYRHPYLLYTSLFVFGTRLTHHVSPKIFGISASSSSSFSSSSPAAQRKAASANARKQKQAARRMEASYEVLGDSHSDEGSDEVDEDINGEEVRGEVELFVRDQIVKTVVMGLGFMMAVVGIWGDGVADLVGDAVVIEL